MGDDKFRFYALSDEDLAALVEAIAKVHDILLKTPGAVPAEIMRVVGLIEIEACEQDDTRHGVDVYAQVDAPLTEDQMIQKRMGSFADFIESLNFEDAPPGDASSQESGDGHE